MKLPEITQEILDKFGNGLCTQWIEWVEKDDQIGDNPHALQWTQTAIDFAHLIEPSAADSRAIRDATKPSGLNANANVLKIKGDEYTASLFEQCETYIAELEAELERLRT